MIIGEAPGAKEDELGLPFVGRSGKLLDQLLEKAGFDIQKDIYICNVIKCRPPNNRKPTKSEIDASMPWLRQQILLVDPKVIALTGATALHAVLRIKEPITQLRGKWLYWEGRAVMPLFHPSYLLRNPSTKINSPKFNTISDLVEIQNKLKSL